MALMGMKGHGRMWEGMKIMQYGKFVTGRRSTKKCTASMKADNILLLNKL